MESKFFNEGVLEMLTALQEVLKKLNIDFYLVGALARDISLSHDPNFAPKRKTNDVDIAILLATEEQFYQVKNTLLESGDFTAHETEAVKLFYKNIIELDLLPFGDIENENRETKIGQPRLFIIDVPGFMEVFPEAETYSLGEGTTLKVCPIEGLVLLKLIANDDRPGRIKDIGDIEHIISVYFDLKTIEIYEEYLEVMDLYEAHDREYLKLVSSRIIGRKIAGMLVGSPQLGDRVIGVLEKRKSGLYWLEILEGIKEERERINSKAVSVSL
ncbi:nucleotidyl transferase AbiEii/AbiGii toxin family protein [Chitinophaga pinensis]|uniref:Nucleotidyltransferase n=1 Tax=Chitinophaga pinensis (strain ATCC 43595 / DSM 2588 / LMG 13176 / NBRC 15968 / NCIMB 11800 / UQM 2034) TaxID=485918 RepID=A0A979GQE2_CHIPD|nr:nucleotidyl transferase AbiEii/AbiGii toxin family protein [Chitinophaga pinensis]ACU57516.1 conserved hypothetical protein [Chitinophaga pinensis DSM 2588]